MQRIDELEKLVALRDEGILTTDEFKRGKEALHVGRVPSVRDRKSPGIKKGATYLFSSVLFIIVLILLVKKTAVFRDATPTFTRPSPIVVEAKHPILVKSMQSETEHSINSRNISLQGEQPHATVSWLAGSWSHQADESLRCDTDVVVGFNRDGTFSDTSFYGRFRITADGRRIVYFNRIMQPDSAEPDSSQDRSRFGTAITTKVERVGDNIMREDGELWYRCKTRS